MVPTLHHSTVTVISTKGQISLGKQYAGRQVLIEEQEPGVCLVRTVTVVPDTERWLHLPPAASDLEHALAWATTNPPGDANTEQLLKELTDGRR